MLPIKLNKDFSFLMMIIHFTSCVTCHSSTSLEELNTERQRRQWQPTPVLLPGKSHGRRSLVGCSLWGR